MATTSSVWEAEHGTSDPAGDEPEGANAGHRFRIHGRLGPELPEQLRPGEHGGHARPGADEGEQLRERLAQATEIDLSDVHIVVEESGIEVAGTVADSGEQQQLTDLVTRLADGKRVTSQLRPRNP